MKKILAMLLAAVMMLAIGVTAFAAEVPTITVSEVSGTAAPGDEITVTVSIKNNPGFFAITLPIEYDADCNAYYVLGFKRGLIDAFSHAFVAKFENDSLKKITRISEDEHTFYRKYKSLQLGGFTEEAFKWKYMDCDLEDIRSKDYKLSGLVR